MADEEVEKMLKEMRVQQNFQEVVQREIAKADNRLEKEAKMPPQKVDRDRERYERWRSKVRNQFEHIKAQYPKDSRRVEVPHDCDTFSRWLEVLGIVDDMSLAFEDSVELDVDSNGNVWLVKR